MLTKQTYSYENDIGMWPESFKAICPHQKSDLFRVGFLDNDGNRSCVSAGQFQNRQTERISQNTWRILYRDYDVFGGSVTVTATKKSAARTCWSISVGNDSPLFIEYIDFPALEVPNDLIGNGGEAALLWPSMEGALITKADNRWFSDQISRCTGYNGAVPGAGLMQFMAYCSPNGGVYYAAHDPDSHLKDFEYRVSDDGRSILLGCRLFPDGASSFDMPYEMVTETFSGDWQDAAAIYRGWALSSGLPLPVKLCEGNETLPAWLEDSPITVIYPVRGCSDKDTDEAMTPNCYYPYERILPHVDRLAGELGSRLMPLLMHWEGSAPWATPYVWPPYGSRESFDRMVSELHRRGHLMGLYASGLGFTNRSVTDSAYDNSAAFAKEGWDGAVCREVDGAPRKVNGLAFVRDGYDTCPYIRQTGDAIISEAVKVAESGVDYYQAFDQNLGGIPRYCWGREHGHPPAPGKWLAECMEDIFRRMAAAIRGAGSEMAFGCEQAASESLMRYLPFNDLRYFTVLRQGIPVPAYSFVYHEYTNNFMGNQNGLENMIDFSKSPDNLLYRTAYAFLAGDMLSVVLGADGRINWGWNAPWNGPFPEQKPVISLLRQANDWRKSWAKKYLRFGRMEKPHEIDCEQSVAFVTLGGDEYRLPNIMTSLFTAQDGSAAQFIANRTSAAQRLRLSGVFENARYLPDADGAGYILPSRADIELPPASIACVLFDCKYQTEGDDGHPLFI